jgi:hypothetical protein
VIYPFLIQIKKKRGETKKCFHTMWRWQETGHRDEQKKKKKKGGGERKRKAIHSNYTYEAGACALGRHILC